MTTPRSTPMLPSSAVPVGHTNSTPLSVSMTTPELTSDADLGGPKNDLVIILGVILGYFLLYFVGVGCYICYNIRQNRKHDATRRRGRGDRVARQDDQRNTDSTLLFINTYSGSITIPSHFSQTPPSAQAPPYAQAPPSYTSVTRPASDRLKNQFNNVSTRGSRNDSATQYGRPPPSYSSVWNTESPGNTSVRRPPSYTSLCQFNNRMTNDAGNTPTYGRPSSFYDSLWGTESSGDIQLNEAVISLSHSSMFSSLPTYSRYTGDSTMADHLQY